MVSMSMAGLSMSTTLVSKNRAVRAAASAAAVVAAATAVVAEAVATVAAAATAVAAAAAEDLAGRHRRSAGSLGEAGRIRSLMGAPGDRRLLFKDSLTRVGSKKVQSAA